MPDNDRLLGLRAIVTGANEGIGEAIARLFAQQQAEVLAVDLPESGIESTFRSVNGITGFGCDVTGDEAPATIMGVAKELLGGLDILVNNAGGNRPQAFVDVDTESLDFIIDLNVRAAFRVAQAATRAMVAAGTKGSIVHMSSQMGHVGSPNRSVYCMTKHAIEGLTKAMAVELAPQGIRVNSVAPTFIETPLTMPMLDDPAFKEFVMGMIPMGKLGTIDDVVAAVMYLVSPSSGMVTGHSLKVDGGWTAH